LTSGSDKSNSLKYNEKNEKNYHAVGTIPKLNIKFVERGKIDISNT